MLLVSGRRPRPLRRSPVQLRGPVSTVTGRPDGALPVPRPVRPLRRLSGRRRAMRRRRARLRQRLRSATGRVPRTPRNTNQVRRTMWSVNVHTHAATAFHSHIHRTTHSFAHSFIHSFIHSFVYLLLCFRPHRAEALSIDVFV